MAYSSRHFLVLFVSSATALRAPVGLACAQPQLASQRTALIRCAADEVASPFEGGGAEASSSSSSSSSGSATGTLEFTVENVDKTLDEVRPYLISDGGNVEVKSVGVEDWSVQLQLQGACGSCPSSTVTMKMGIERILREKWPDLGEVVDVGGGAEVETKELSIETAYEALQTIMPAISGLGGSVRIVSAGETAGKVVLEYTGPEKIKFGIELALKDSPLIETVEFL